jgi:ankyrin repeat protein
MIELLMQHNADANMTNFLFGRTPLHYAVDSGHTTSVKLMLEYGADPGLKDR